MVSTGQRSSLEAVQLRCAWISRISVTVSASACWTWASIAEPNRRGAFDSPLYCRAASRRVRPVPRDRSRCSPSASRCAFREIYGRTRIAGTRRSPCSRWPRPSASRCSPRISRCRAATGSAATPRELFCRSSEFHQENSLSRASTSTSPRGSLRERATREAERAVDRRVRRAPNAGNFHRSVALLQGDPKVWLRESVLRDLSGRGVAHAMWSCGACSYGAVGALHLAHLCRLD